ncbi:thiosulfate/3-mercaptopyruvate sulfurtransferase [Roseomonas rosea]|uniref:Sulfurtransferase n=1 Tax=Muricoccus roseus TaxID=198092 RepID=A0A1M6D951_9PROT|nr:sulfurtransferase [Roseomonas rosea]SHI69755.1 thiosulfate/3-mercaptopyruvate sulfurtransferase [Roseomonas rosea]
MAFTTLIQAGELVALLAQGPDRILVCDCSADLTDPSAGARVHAAGHLPGAMHLELERDLSAAKTGRNGRHPLPSREDFAARMAALGLSAGMQVVAYDNAAGMYAARLWWMLRWIGHEAAAVLDGGLPAWQAAGGALETGTPAPRRAGDLALRPSLVPTVDYPTVLADLGPRTRQVLDARAPDRFRGENETLDPVGGHIPGARNRFFRDNLGPDGRFKPASVLHAEFDAITGGRPAAELVAQCGSGVTACHNLLAMEVAGLHGASLYAGSWSEWSAQPDAPVGQGAAR